MLKSNVIHVVRLLLSHNTNPNIPDKNGTTALQFLRHIRSAFTYFQYIRILSLLKQYKFPHTLDSTTEKLVQNDQERYDAKLTLVMALHPRLGVNSQVRNFDTEIIQTIAGYIPIH
jgi:hypothetical protein